MEENRVNLQPYTELLMTNAMLDCKVQEYQAMIKCKIDENGKYEGNITEYKSKIEQLQKSIQKALEREEKVKNNIDSLRNSRLTTEGLLTSMKHELQNIQEKREETKKTRTKIIGKYSKIFKAFKDEYKTLPWIQKKHELKNLSEIGRIKLNILKSEFSSTKKKTILFKNINEQRIRIGIINLAKLIVERNNLQKENGLIDEQIKKLEITMKTLEEEKNKIKELRDKKISAAISEARERAVKTLTSPGIEKLVLPTPIQPAPVKKSIFARLGFEGPLTLKRIAPVSASQISQKLPHVSNIQLGIHASEWKQMEISSATKEISESPTITSQKPSDMQEKLEKNMELPQSNEILPAMQACTNNNTVGNPQLKNLVSDPSPQEDHENTSVQDEPERKKKKLKKKVKKNSPVKAKEKTAIKIVKKVTFLDEKNDPVSNKKNLCLPATKENVQKLHKKENPEIENEQDVKEKSKPTSPIPISEDNIEKESCTAEDTGNLGDISMDTDSVMSLNFLSENRDDINDILSRNLESPDFLIQRPSGFCFSPPLGQTSTPEKSEKEKQSVPDFMGSSSSSFFSNDLSKKSEGHASSFFDFFKSSSPKKSDNSTKSFFQLF